MNETINVMSEKAVSSLEECALLESLAREIWEEFFISILEKDQIAYMLKKYQSAPALWAQIQEGVSYFLVFYRGEIAGYYAVKNEKECLFLSKIYLKRSMRGLKIGLWMLKQCFKIAENKKLPYIYLTVNKHNLSSIGFYERNGFEKKKPLEKDIGNGFIMDDWQMEKHFN